MNRATWSSLALRCEEADGPDHDLDLALANAIYPRPPVNYDPELWLIRHGGIVDSIDAIVALIEQEFPDNAFMAGKGKVRAEDTPYGAIIFDRLMGNGRQAIGTGEAATWPLALCAAFCVAMAGKGKA